MASEFSKTSILDCNHCGNRTPHELCFERTSTMVYDELDNGEKIHNSYTWLCYECGTCGAINLYGAFFNVDLRVSDIKKAKLHPRGSDVLPPPHTMSPSQPIPPNILSLYEEVWPLRYRAPAAFISQVRRLLEFVCKEKGAEGKDLSSKGIFPGYFSKISDLLRKVGNMGAHAADEGLSVWDAELIDDFFRSIIDYVYIAPARIKRMENRLKTHDK